MWAIDSKLLNEINDRIRFLSVGFFPVLMFFGGALIFYLIFFPFDLFHFIFIAFIILFSFFLTSHFYYYARKNEINKILDTTEKILLGELNNTEELEKLFEDENTFLRLEKFIDEIDMQQKKLIKL